MPMIERVVLVHGTGAFKNSDEGEAWWQKSGGLWSRLAALSPNDVQLEAFTWTGANDEEERRAAARSLAIKLLEMSARGERVHLIGHSHGGSVIWHALGILDTCDVVNGFVLSWATVGTPFLHYGLRRSRVIFALISSVASVVVLASAAASILDVKISYAWRDEQMSTGLWLASASVPALILIFSLRVFGRALQAWRGRSKPSANLIGTEAAERYLGLWSTQDETIIGLGASTSFSLKLMGEGAGFNPHSIRALFHPIAAASNQFVSNLVSRKIQGSNIPGLELVGTTHHPHPALAQQALDVVVDRALIDSADTHSGDLGRRVRSLLLAGKDPVTGFADLQSAAERALTFKELVHTTYFSNPSCLNLLTWHVATHSPNIARGGAVQDAPSWYQSRSSSDADRVQAQPSTLPSNRLGYFIAVGSATLVAFLLSLMATLGSLHRVALAPTTSQYQLDQIIDRDVVTAVIAATSAGNHDAAKEFMKIAADAGGLQRFIAVGDSLHNPHLNLAYASLLWELSEIANHEDAKAMLHQHKTIESTTLPISKSGLESTERVLLLPGGLIGAIARNGALTNDDFDAIRPVCKGATTCLDRLRIEFILNAVRYGRDVPSKALPIPPSTVLYFSQKDGQAFEDFLWRDDELRELEGAGEAMAWLIRRDVWGYTDQLLTHVSGALEWSAFSAGAQRQLDNPKASLEPVAKLLATAEWSAPVPVKFMKELRKAIGHPSNGSAPSPQLLDVAKELDARIAQASCQAASSSTASCGGLDANTGLPPLRASGISASKSNAGRVAAVLSAAREFLCSNQPTVASDSRAEQDGTEAIDKLMRELGRARKDDAPVIQRWLKVGRAEEPVCPAPPVHGSYSARFGSLKHLNHLLAKWIDPIDAKLADELFDSLSADVVFWNDQKQHAWSSAWDEIAAQRAVSRHAYAHAIGDFEILRSGGLLIRRAAFFGLASCLQESGRKDDANAVKLLAEDIAIASRQVGYEAKAEALLSSRVAEARYFASQRDWRSAARACEGCTPEMKVDFAKAMLPVFQRGRLDPFPAAACAWAGEDKSAGLLESLMKRERVLAKERSMGGIF